MKRTILTRCLRGAILLLCLLALFPWMLCSVAAATEPVISYGLVVLSARTDMAVSAQVGNEIAFSQDLFARSLNLSDVQYVTFKSLPDTVSGELLLGSSRIAAGQSVSAENLAYVTFCPATEEVMQASFTFCVNGGTIPMVCNLYMLSEVNYTPTVSLASGLSLNQSTYRNCSSYGRLCGYDPDGDALHYEIVSYPKKGSVRMTDAALGTYVYTPQRGYTGSDSFSYVVRDRYGNYSAAATVSFKISIPGTSVTYVDMQDSPYYNAALAVTEAGIMSGAQIGDRYCFDPQREVSRLEFLVMAMHAAGISSVPDADVTVFADDAEIPGHMKGYVHTAYSLGYISGTLINGSLYFLPDEAISRAQAAVVLADLLSLEGADAMPAFADHNEIPAWASEAIYSLNSIGVMNSFDGYIEATESLTREQTAAMLAATMAYIERNP